MGTLPTMSQFVLLEIVGLALALGLTPRLVAAQETPSVPPTAVEQKAEPSAELSEPEKTRIDLLAMTRQRDLALEQRDQCAAQLGPLQARQREDQLRGQIATLRTLIEKTHPGYVWDLERGTLVKKPSTPTPADPAPRALPADPPKKKE